MNVTVADVEANYGLPLTDAQTVQVHQWIRWATATITRGPTGWNQPRNLNDLDIDAVQMVIVEAVTRRLRNPNADRQTTIGVDDGTVTRTHAEFTGLIDILPEWWTALGWDPTPPAGPQAFTIRPHYQPDTGRVRR